MGIHNAKSRSIMGTHIELRFFVLLVFDDGFFMFTFLDVLTGYSKSSKRAKQVIR